MSDLPAALEGESAAEYRTRIARVRAEQHAARQAEWKRQREEACARQLMEIEQALVGLVGAVEIEFNSENAPLQLTIRTAVGSIEIGPTMWTDVYGLDVEVTR